MPVSASSMPHEHIEHIQEQFPNLLCVAEPVNLSDAMRIPAARAAIDQEGFGGDFDCQPLIDQSESRTLSGDSPGETRAFLGDSGTANIDDIDEYYNNANCPSDRSPEDSIVESSGFDLSLAYSDSELGEHNHLDDHTDGDETDTGSNSANAGDNTHNTAAQHHQYRTLRFSI